MAKSDIIYILELNKQIEEFVKNQKEVIRTFKKDNEIRQCDDTFIDSLLHNLDTLIYKKNKILGLGDDDK